jgi:hypothetical protein
VVCSLFTKHQRNQRKKVDQKGHEEKELGAATKSFQSAFTNHYD